MLQFDETAYRNVVCLGHLIAEDGRKMSKSLGNQFDPWEALDRQGADALRWWMLTNGSPWESRRIGHEILDEHVRQFLLPLWNVYAFFVTYANASGVDADEVDATPTDPMDRWIRSQLAEHRRRRPRPDGARTTRRPPGAGSRPSSTICRGGTCGVHAAASGTRAPAGTPAATPPSRRCTCASSP